MINRYLFGIDIGTSSTKVAIQSSDGSFIAIERLEHSISSPNEGWAELSIDEVWNNIIILTKKLLNKSDVNPGAIKAIGISCLCPGLIPFDKHGNTLLNPIIFMDNRSNKEVAMIRDRISDEDLFKMSGNKLMAGACSLTSMLWIKNNKNEIYNKTKYFGHINTFLVHKLTGVFGIDFTNASYTGLFETSGDLKWSADVANTVGVDVEKLPPLIRSDSIAGELSSQEIIDIGLAKGIPVVMGGADTACSALAIGVIEHNQVFESVGTTNVITVCSEKPTFDIHFMNRCHVIENRWLSHGAMSSTGASLKWFRDEFCNDFVIQEEQSGISAYQLMDDLVKSSNDGANGLIFLPYMVGERTPVWDSNAKGVFFGLSLQTKRSDLIRSILEGCGYGLRQIIEIAEHMTGEKINEFISIGGGSKSQIWAEIKSDITGKTIRVLDFNDAAVIGAMLLAGLAVGFYKNPVEAGACISKNISKVVSPQSHNNTIHDSNYNIYKSLYPLLKELFSMSENGKFQKGKP
jgi:xylulokinase